jgi:hypothetical protein
MKIEFSFDTETWKFSAINTETGEVAETQIKKPKTASKKTPKTNLDEDVARLELLENKIQLNNAAAEALNLDSTSKVAIVYGQKSNKDYPIIGTTDVLDVKDGNKVTKSLTIAYRGQKHDTLSGYGTKFTFKPNPNLEGSFLLVSEATPELTEETEDEISFPTDDELSQLDELTSDDEVTEISANFFTFK